MDQTAFGRRLVTKFVCLVQKVAVRCLLDVFHLSYKAMV